jgi:Cu(I)/Ag(I) efflux system membrane protein CusA/SilA
MQAAFTKQVQLPAGYSIGWSGQFEFWEHAVARLKVVVPATLLIIYVLLYLNFRRADEALLILASVPFALIGGFWFMYLLGYAMSIASAVGFIALAGVATEFGVIMLLYVKQAMLRQHAAGESATADSLLAAIQEGAGKRVRPIAMTASVIIAGLLPIMLGSGTGSEVMQRIAAPMVGGMLTAPLLSMLVIPAAYRLLQGRKLARSAVTDLPSRHDLQL